MHDVPPTTLYRLGRCAEEDADLAAAEKVCSGWWYWGGVMVCGFIPSLSLARASNFVQNSHPRCSSSQTHTRPHTQFYSWALDVTIGDRHSMESLKVVKSWAKRDCKRARAKYVSCKRRRKKWAAHGGGEISKNGIPDAEDREYEVQLDSDLSFTARTLMLHTRLVKYANLRVKGVKIAVGKLWTEGEGAELISVVERGWEGRMLCKFAGRDSWQCIGGSVDTYINT